MSIAALKGRWRFARKKLQLGDESARSEWESLDAELRAAVSPAEYAALAESLAPKSAAKPEWPKRMWSQVLGEHFWLVRNDADAAGVPEGDAYYTQADIQALKGKTPEHLREVHAARKVFPGGRLLA